MSDKLEYFGDCDTGNFEVNPEAMDAGLVTKVGSDVHLTLAGLFASVGQLSNDLSADADGRFRKAFGRVLSSAREAGLQRKTEREIRQSFSQGINPCDGSKKGAVLAAQCRSVANLLGAHGFVCSSMYETTRRK